MTGPAAGGVVFLYVTLPDEAAALALATTLVAERLAACGNVFPAMRSVYRWQERVEQAGEAVLIVKTTAASAQAATERIRALHPYEVPCIVTLPITGGNPAFLAWIAEQVAK